MKNNKGFTLVELLVSFTLAMALVIIMFQLIINLKEVYMTSGLKTEMLNKQYIMTNKIYTDLTEKKLNIIANCEGISECIDFTFSDGITKRFVVDMDNGLVTYDNYTIKLNNTSYFTEVSITKNGSTGTIGSNRILEINVPIYNTQFKTDNFGIKIIYMYNNSDLTDNYY